MSEQRDHLKSLYEFEAWRGRSTLDEGLFIWQFYLSGEEIPGWRARHAQAIPAIAGFPPMIQSAWQPDAGDAGGSLVTVDAFECDSLAAAHEFLLRSLGEFQGPALSRVAAGEIGDVAFSPRSDTLLLFARANLVLRVRSAGERPAAVADVARSLDQEFVRRPEQGGRTIDAARLQQFQPHGAKQDARVLLDLKEYEQPERVFWYKFFARGGEVFAADGLLLYRQTSDGPQELTVFEVRPTRDYDRRKTPFKFL